jgi:hypothetical protein
MYGFDWNNFVRKVLGKLDAACPQKAWGAETVKSSGRHSTFERAGYFRTLSGLSPE